MDVSQLLTGGDRMAPVAPHTENNHDKPVQDLVARPNGYSTRAQTAAKDLKFPLLLSEGSQHRARLPLRVNVHPHDTTESIISTVKNFYGLYEGEGLSFESEEGLTLIPCFENLPRTGTVQVKLTNDTGPIAPVDACGEHYTSMPLSASPIKGFFDNVPQPSNVGLSRPPSRMTTKRSASPQHRVGRSTPQWTLHQADHESALVSEDDDARSDSFTSSKRAKSDHLASAEISLDNIIEGNRRTGPKFESSVLPLFKPPQHPEAASASSVSPQKQYMSNAAMPSPHNLGYLSFNPYTSLLSPQSSNADAFSSGLKSRPVLSNKGKGQHMRALPTPDPTIRSTISDEDVAWQLMRLGNPSHGRTSTSTLDDTLSGKAVRLSSESVTNDSSDDDEDDDERDGMSFAAKHKKHGPPKKKQKLSSGQGHAHSPSVPSVPGLSRKNSTTSSIQYQLASDEEDLSAKPRCQRCRKSKKGCDRQRPCGRCKDAGIGVEGCVSEDEGNGRKGRFGRVMGVPIKKSPGDNLSPVSATTPDSMMAAFGPVGDKSKKRKR